MRVSNDYRETDPREKSCLYLRNEEMQGGPKKQDHSVGMTNLLSKHNLMYWQCDDKLALSLKEIQRWEM